MENNMDRSSRLVYRAFQDIDTYLDDLYSVYVDAYPSVPKVEFRTELEDEYAFNYCRVRKYFILITPYTKQREILVERSFANDRLT